jgi:hypothetical protein
MDKKINPARPRDLRIISGLFFIVLTFIFLFLGYRVLADPIGAALWEAEIDGAEKRWNGRHISSYTIQVQEWSWWHVQNYTVVVRDGKVTNSSSTCGSAPGADSPCDLYNFDPNNFTVPGLFVAAREWGMKDMVTFSHDFGFPLTIDYDTPGIADDERGLKVLEFHPEGS